MVALYLTGGGALHPRAIDGAVPDSAAFRLAAPVTATIGGVSAEVLYAGAAPGFVFGAGQINVGIPAAAPAGDAVEVRLQVGAATAGGRILSIR